MNEDPGTDLPAVPDLAETGNYPDPGDGPQDHLDQSTQPQFDEDLVDGADVDEDTP